MVLFAKARIPESKNQEAEEGVVLLDITTNTPFSKIYLGYAELELLVPKEEITLPGNTFCFH